MSLAKYANELNISKVRELLEGYKAGRIKLDLYAVDDESKYTTLIVAAAYGWEDIISLLIEGKVDINHRDHDQMTALMVASYNGRVDVVRLLLTHGANPHLRSGRDTALGHAADNNRWECVDLLLRAGANPNVQNIDGKTPLMLTVDGKTPLMLTVDDLYCQSLYPRDIDMFQTLRILLRAGADINLVDWNGESVWTTIKDYNDGVKDFLLAWTKYRHLREFFLSQGLVVDILSIIQDYLG